MANNQLRLEQFDTILYNANLNPMGVPESVVKAINENANRVVCYPGDYMAELKSTIAGYASCDESDLIFGNGKADMLYKLTKLLNPKKVKLISPTFSEYETTLSNEDCEISFFDLYEEDNFEFNIADFVASLDSSYDLIILGNPNNPTSQLISKDDIETLTMVCKELDIYLIIDEMYIEFVENYESFTCVPLARDNDNLIVMRSVSKFFAVPGIRLSYAILHNPALKSEFVTTFANSIATLSAIACIAMMKDKSYISSSVSQIYTERNLIYSAMSTNKNVKLFKPQANFILVKILKDDVCAADIAEHCKLKGIMIRTCENFRGLNNKFIRFCFMKPEQNDLLVNTVLELL